MVPKEVEQYCEAHSSPEAAFLAALNRETHLTQVYPRMLSGPMQGTFLRFVSQMIRPSKVLEIGTFTGYSAINLALGCEGIVHTIEVNQELEHMIRKYILESGTVNRIVLHIGEALEIIPTLDETWDLVFIDADKPNYLNYYNLIFPNVRKGGWIIADNALWDGKVLSADTRDKDTIGIKEYNDFIMKDERVEKLLLPFRDGLMIARKI